MKKKIELRFELIANFLNNFFPVSKELVQHLASISYFKEVKGGSIILKIGDRCSNVYLIKKGIVRGFVKIGNKEITSWITCENELATSISSFFTNKISKENIQSLEESTLLVFDNVNLDLVFKKFPEFNEVVRKILQLYYSQAEERAYITRLPRAIDKWNYLFINLNKFIHRVPLKYTASFLGIRIETLSRIRSLIIKG